MSKFEVRNYELSDEHDYLITQKDSLEEALKYIRDFYEPHPETSLYEHLYVLEIAEDGTISNPEYNRDTYTVV